MKRFAMGLNAKCNGGERELASGDTERESVCVCVWEREREREAERMRKREVASVQRSPDFHNHKEEMQSDKKDKLCW